MKRSSSIIAIYKTYRIFLVLMILSGLVTIPIDRQAAAFIHQYCYSSPVAVLVCRLLHALGTVKMKHAYLSYGDGYDWLSLSHVFLGLLLMGIDTRFTKHMRLLEAGFLLYITMLMIAILEGIIKDIPFWWQIANYVFGLAGFVLMWAYYHASKKTGDPVPAEDE